MMSDLQLSFKDEGSEAEKYFEEHKLSIISYLARSIPHFAIVQFILCTQTRKPALIITLANHPPFRALCADKDVFERARADRMVQVADALKAYQTFPDRYPEMNLYHMMDFCIYYRSRNNPRQRVPLYKNPKIKFTVPPPE